MKREFIDYWGLICGILILIAIPMTNPINSWGLICYLGIGGGGTLLILNFFLKDVKRGLEE